MSQVIAHFEIEELIGSGGMGRVYRAKDLALGRMCALKLLPAEFPDHLRDRLLHEARTAARLQHPSIATFFEAGQVDDQAYIAMELVDGITLRKRMRQGAIPLEDALSQTACLLDGLGHAHAVGILHRDIKPENVMVVNDQSVKLLDFGLAKDVVKTNVDDKTMTQLTEQGAVVGTVGYMSPEQLRGEKLDERTDLFAVGALLYESVSGKPAFPGKTPTERMANILASEPAPLTGEYMAGQLNTVIERSLAKDRGCRYASAKEFLTDLSLFASGELRTSLPNSVVVTDFENISGNPDDQWIGTGIAESLTADLSGVKSIDVVPRAKLNKFMAEQTAEGEPADRNKVGLRLGCRWIVTGGFQRMGDSIRITMQLSELSIDQNVLSEKVDGSVGSVFNMQDELATLIRKQLANRSLADDVGLEAASTKIRPKFSAYECYVKGYQAWLRGGKADLDEAQRLFQQAIEMDPQYALAYAGLTTAHALQFTYKTDEELISKAKTFALKALDLDPQLAEAHVWLGYVYICEYDIADAFRHQQLAIKVDPGHYLAHYFAGGCLIATNSTAEALGLYQQIHPGKLSENVHRWRFEQAITHYQSAVQVSPEYVWAWLGAATAHLALNQFRESEICMQRAYDAAKVADTLPGVQGYLCETLRRMGQLDNARSIGLAGIEAMENADNMYRDTMRAVILCSLGRAAIDQRDQMAASVAFNQAVQHLRGRSRARGGGHPFVQALAGFAEANQDPSALEEALQVYRDPGNWSFHFLYLCTADITLCALARAAAAVGKTGLAAQLRDEAIDYGSIEAADIKIG